MMSSSALLRSLVAGCLFCANAWGSYTYYFTWRQKPDPAALRECLSEMRLLVESRRLRLAGPEGVGAPMLTLGGLEFNGGGQDSTEPFSFPGTIERDNPVPQLPAGYNVCRTAGKPYDEVVTACLMVARDHFPPSVLAIASDGTWEEDWREGAKLYATVINRPVASPLGGRVTDEGGMAFGIPLEWLVYGGIASFVVFVVVKKKAGLFR